MAVMDKDSKPLYTAEEKDENEDEDFTSGGDNNTCKEEPKYDFSSNTIR